MNASNSYSVKKEPEDESDQHEKKQITDERHEGIKKEDVMVVGSDKWLRQCFEIKEEQEEEKPFLPDIHKFEAKYCQEVARNNEQTAYVSHPSHSKKLEMKYTSNEKTRQSQMSEDMLNDASVSENADPGLCQFKCERCCATFVQWIKFSLHMRNNHDLPVKKAHILSYMEKLTVHICKICCKKVLCESNELTNHFRDWHNMRLSEYRSRYGNTRAEYDLKLKLGTLSPVIVGNLCIFKCPLCLASFNSLDTFYRHNTRDLVRRKKCNLKNAKNHLHKYLLEVITHKCKICSKLLLCDTSAILKHTLSNHNIRTLEKYANKTGCTVHVQDHLMKDTFDKITREAAFQKHIGNYCMFSCKKCGLDTNSWRMMKKHLVLKDHWSNRGKAWSNYITKTVLHICLVCNRKILNDKYFVYTHLQNNHFPEVSLRHYKKFLCKQYVKIIRVNTGK